LNKFLNFDNSDSHIDEKDDILETRNSNTESENIEKEDDIENENKNTDTMHIETQKLEKEKLNGIENLKNRKKVFLEDELYAKSEDELSRKSITQ
jgi:hypothetical protein